MRTENSIIAMPGVRYGISYGSYPVELWHVRVHGTGTVQYRTWYGIIFIERERSYEDDGITIICVYLLTYCCTVPVPYVATVTIPSVYGIQARYNYSTVLDAVSGREVPCSTDAV